MPTIVRGGGGAGGGWPDGWKQEDTGEASGAISKNDPVVLQTSGTWNTGINRIPDIGDSSIGYNRVSYSGDSNHMVLASSTHYPKLQFYKYAGQTYTALAQPSTIPNYLTSAVAFAPSAPYVAFGTASGYEAAAIVYKRSGDTFTKLATMPALSDTSAVTDILWSPDSSELFIAIYKTIYVLNRNGDTFTKVQEISFSNNINNMSISPDGLILIAAFTETTAIYPHKLVNGQYCQYNSTVFGSGINNGSCAFSSDNKYFVRYGRGTISQGGYLALFLRGSDDTFSKIDTISAPYSTINASLSFDISGEYLQLGANEDRDKSVSLYRLQGGSLTRLPSPNNSQLNSDMVNGSAFSRDGQFLAAIGKMSPYKLAIWSTVSKKYVAKIGFVEPSPLWWLPQGKLGIALEGKTKGQQVKVNLFPKLNTMI